MAAQDQATEARGIMDRVKARLKAVALECRVRHGGKVKMTCWTRDELEQMLFDVVNELDLSDGMIDEHGPLGTPPAELVRLVLERKDRTITMLKQGFVEVVPNLEVERR